MQSLRKYDPGLHPTLCYYMALAGLTLQQIAEKIGVSDRTLDLWCKKHPELKDAMRPGKDFVDNLVEGSLLKRALGYDIVEITRERVAVEYESRGAIQIPVVWQMKVTKKVTKHIPGEVAANIFWLKNRKGWRDRVDINHAGSISTKPDYSKLTEEELETMRVLAGKAEVASAGRN